MKIKYQRNYYVPVVVKSRDYLIGFLTALNSLDDILKYDETILDSCRYNDWLPDGSRRRDRSTEEIKEIMNQHFESLNVKENENEESEDNYFFKVSCSCGNFHGFYHPVEIPHENLKCELCGKILIDYCGYHDYETDYDGDVDKMTAELQGDEDDEEP